MYYTFNPYGMPLNHYGMRTYIPYANYSISNRSLEYKPVTAYTATQPILVNGKNINTGPYPILNFQPEGTLYPYIYVPIAEFSKVGATVQWNEAQQLLTVVTDYFKNKSQLENCQAILDTMQQEQPEKPLLYEGFEEEIGYHFLGGTMWRLVTNKEKLGLTPGKYYKGIEDNPDPISGPPGIPLRHLMITNDYGERITFNTTRA